MMKHFSHWAAAATTALFLITGCSRGGGGGGANSAPATTGPMRFEGGWVGEWFAPTGEQGALFATFFVDGIDVQGSIDFDGTDCFDYSDFFGYADGSDLFGEVSWLDYLGDYNVAILDGQLSATGNRIIGTLDVTDGDCEGAHASFYLEFQGALDSHLEQLR